MIGRKRHFEENKSNTSSSISNHIKKSSHSSSRGDKTKRPATSKIKKEIVCFYNMKRSTCMNCILSKNKKYSTNTIVPCMPSSTI